MEYSMICLVLSLLWKSSASIRCYKCEPEPDPHDIYSQLCQNFNGSEAFHVDCKDSTICFKKETSYSFGNGLNVAVQRGCAPQTLNGDQEKTEHGWRPIRRIYEVYNETCTEDQTDDGRIFKTVNCYCRGDFCNGSLRIRPPSLILLFISLAIIVTSIVP